MKPISKTTLFVVAFILCSQIMYGCGGSDDPNPVRPPFQREGLPYGIGKFRDGKTTCYTNYEHGISCVKDTK